MGAGIAFTTYDQVIPADFSPCFRYGIINKVDVGFKLAGMPGLAYSFFADMKCNFLEHPLLLSGDFGFMTFGEEAPDWELKAFGVSPTILFGNDRIYGGIGWNYFILRETQWPMFKEPYTSISRESCPRIIIGTSFGRRWKVNSEVIFSYYSSDEFPGPVVVGFGIHSVFIKKNFGINAGLAIPSGSLGDTQKMGFEFGGIARIATGSPSIMVSVGATYMMFPGKTDLVDFTLFQVFVGPQFGKEKGAYLLPAIAGNFSENWICLGLDIGAGVLLPISIDNTKFDIGVKYSLMNIIRREQGKGSANAIRLRVGVAL